MTILLENEIISDGEIYLKLREKFEGDTTKGFVPEFKFDIFSCKTNEIVGYINFRTGNTEKIIKYIGHIGYGIKEEYRGNRYSAKACNLIKKIAIENNIENIIITCNPNNYASRRICDIIGAKFIEIVDVPPEIGDKDKQKCRYEWAVTR